MERIIKAGDYEFPAKSTAASLISYKANFGRDGLRDLIKLSSAMPKGNVEEIIESDELDLDVFYRFLWVFAKASTPDIPPLEQWLEGFDMPPLDFATAALGPVVELLSSTAKSTVKPKNSPAAAKKK